jgi:hypothetical protein
MFGEIDLPWRRLLCMKTGSGKCEFTALPPLRQRDAKYANHRFGNSCRSTRHPAPAGELVEIEMQGEI